MHWVQGKETSYVLYLAIRVRDSQDWQELERHASFVGRPALNQIRNKKSGSALTLACFLQRVEVLKDGVSGSVPYRINWGPVCIGIGEHAPRVGASKVDPEVSVSVL